MAFDPIGVAQLFYQAALEPDLWRTALHEFSQAFGSEGAILVPPSTVGLSPTYSEGLDEIVTEGIRGGWLDRNPRLQRSSSLTDSGQVAVDWMLFSADEIERHPWNVGYVHRFGFKWFMGADLRPGDRVTLSLERKAQQGPFETSDLDRFRTVLPMLRQAAIIAETLARQRVSGMLEAFERSAVGAFVLDRSGRVMEANAAAEHMVRGHVRLRKGVLLHSTHPSFESAIATLIQSTIQFALGRQPAPSGPAFAPRGANLPLLFYGVPLFTQLPPLLSKAVALLLVVDPSRESETDVSVLRALYKLSRAEAKVAILIGKGCDIGEISARHGVSEQTTRSHLKSIYRKLDISRQPELVIRVQQLAKRF